MMKNNKQVTISNKLLLFLIIFLGFFLRLYRLDTFPIGFTPDEAAQGYTAYSILKTGKDEWGVKLPINLRSFGDFKAPIQTYSMIPSIAVFGLNEFSVRLPNALLSALSILIAYFLTKELFGKHKTMDTQKLALLSAFLLAVNPWHISLSRGAFEANLTTFFLPLGVWLFLRASNDTSARHFPPDTVHHNFLISNIPACNALRSNAGRQYLISGLILGLNLFTYHSAKIVTPLLFAFCLLFVGGWKTWKPKLIVGALFLLFLLIALVGFTQGGSVRSSDISVFNNSSAASAEERYRLALGGAGGTIPRLFHNKIAEPVKEFSQNYLSYLSPYFLFGRGAGEGTYGMTPGFGLFYQIEAIWLIFCFIGLISKIIKKENIAPWLFLCFWVLIGFIPASLSRGVGYHANRAVVVLPACQILIAYGALELFGLLKKKRRLMFVCVVTIYLLSISRFIVHYFYYAPVVNAKPMNYGWREAASYLKENNPANCPVIVSSELSEPQAYLAFYQKIEPLQFQGESLSWLVYQKQGLKFVDQMGDYQLANYRFCSFGMPEDLIGDCHFLLGRMEDFQLYNETITDYTQKGLLVDKIINYPDDSPAMRILTIR